MIDLIELEISPELQETLRQFILEVDAFREEGPLDSISVAKLEEHFKAAHVYHSAGIEGNRLTLQETNLVLQDGIDIQGKPIKDTIEVKQLGMAFDYLKQLASREGKITEVDIRNLHQLIIGNDPKSTPGQYRMVGVVISGSEHRPPEPIAVPSRMHDLVDWINHNFPQNPLIVATIAHHELAAIHPFTDGNGRVSRLLMNLILLKRGLPICNIRREDRPAYYEALTFADVGLYDALVELIYQRSADLFSEYVRIRTETKRMVEWASRWGNQASDVLMKREVREMELWQSRMRQVFLEFQKASELLDDQLQKHQINIKFYDYKREISFEDYQQLKERGYIPRSNVFSIQFFNEATEEIYWRFMFRYFRNWDKFNKEDAFIPLELNCFDSDMGSYIRLVDLQWADRIRLRELYFTDKGEFIVRIYAHSEQREVEKTGHTISEIVQWFFDDILQNVIGLH